MRGRAPSSHLRRISYALLIVLLSSIVLAGISRWYDGHASALTLRAYPPPGQFVAVGAARMHYLCQGTGEPTLVLQAGFGGGALDWQPIMPALARHTRVCAFDRLGQDWSDAAPQPRTFRTAADELHTALEQLGITRPVLVGHSLGGALVQVYAAHYPVSGVVLVDGLTGDLVEPVVARLGSYHRLAPVARLGLLRLLSAALVDTGYPAALRTQMIALRSRADALVNVTDEGAVAAASAAAELRAAEQHLDMPLLLIAAEHSEVPELPTGAFATAVEALAARTPNSTFVLVADAPHYLQASHPDEVIQAIEAWLPSTER